MTPTTRAGQALPLHTRLILASEDLLEAWGARTIDGYRISAEWGDEKPEGWYEPTFTVHYDDDLGAEARAAERSRIRAEFRQWMEAAYYDALKDTRAPIEILDAILDAPEAIGA